MRRNLPSPFEEPAPDAPFLPIREWEKRHGWPTAKQWQYYRGQGMTDDVIFKVGKNLVVDVERVRNWVRNQKDGGSLPP